MARKCPICNIQFEKRGRKAYCSDKCKTKGKAKHRIKQLADMRVRTKTCKELGVKPIDKKFLVRGTISNSNRANSISQGA